MPKVGGKHFPYTEAGKKAAKAYAKQTGKDIGPLTPGKKSKAKYQLPRSPKGTKTNFKSAPYRAPKVIKPRKSV